MWPAKGNIAEGSYCDVCHEHDKMTFIMEADTLVYPWTMVIELQHAAITDSTMVCPLILGLAALGTLGNRRRGYV